jgi:serine/threonine protein phosphatase PrpC
MTSSDPATPAGSNEPAEVVDPAERPWRGCFVPYVVGEEGAAARLVVARPAAGFPERRDIVVDGVTIHDEAGAPVAHLRAASIRGLSHRYYGGPRQDAYAFRTTADGRWLVVAVADGVSAGAYSHVAAEVVTYDGCRLLVDRLVDGGPRQLDWAGLLRDLAERIVTRGRDMLVSAGVVDTAEPGERTVAEYMSATALFAVVGLTPAEPGSDDAGRPVYCMTVGDTSAWVLRPDQEVPWRPVSRQRAAEDGVASSATFALPLAPKVLSAAKAETLAPGAAVVLVTDGIGDPLGDGTGEVGRFLAAVWAQPPGPLEFAAQVDFARRSYDDDRTAVVVWVPEAA